jgi:hypothetical protein
MFFVINATNGFRVREEEIEGLDYGEHEMHAYDTWHELGISGASLCDGGSGSRVVETAKKSAKW